MLRAGFKSPPKREAYLEPIILSQPSLLPHRVVGRVKRGGTFHVSHPEFLGVRVGLGGGGGGGEFLLPVEFSKRMGYISQEKKRVATGTYTRTCCGLALHLNGPRKVIQDLRTAFLNTEQPLGLQPPEFPAALYYNKLGMCPEKVP